MERFFKTVREQFLTETDPVLAQVSAPREALDALNWHFNAWVATVYHPRVHSETGQPPIRRWLAGTPPAFPHPEQLREAFLWSKLRTVTKTATVSLHGNIYQVEPALTGRKVELVFDPFDLERIDVRHDGQPAGTAIPHEIRRHAHPKTRPELPVETPKSTGIDYLHLIAQAHDTRLATGINYQALDGSDGSDDERTAADEVTSVDGGVR